MYLQTVVQEIVSRHHRPLSETNYSKFPSFLKALSILVTLEANANSGLRQHKSDCSVTGQFLSYLCVRVEIL